MGTDAFRTTVRKRVASVALKTQKHRRSFVRGAIVRQSSAGKFYLSGIGRVCGLASGSAANDMAALSMYLEVRGLPHRAAF